MRSRLVVGIALALAALGTQGACSSASKKPPPTDLDLGTSRALPPGEGAAGGGAGATGSA
ncbi:MAG: hypothetical protein H0X17_20075, partial [Deltaproteobacteria bacterium]|nr:hypothetical protein [Deltaproteobacteria bacterium]